MMTKGRRQQAGWVWSDVLTGFSRMGFAFEENFPLQGLRQAGTRIGSGPTLVEAWGARRRRR
jgi:hypothetical protein